MMSINISETAMSFCHCLGEIITNWLHNLLFDQCLKYSLKDLNHSNSFYRVVTNTISLTLMWVSLQMTLRSITAHFFIGCQLYSPKAAQKDSFIVIDRYIIISHFKTSWKPFYDTHSQKFYLVLCDERIYRGFIYHLVTVNFV